MIDAISVSILKVNAVYILQFLLNQIAALNVVSVDVPLTHKMEYAKFVGKNIYISNIFFYMGIENLKTKVHACFAFHKSTTYYSCN